MPSALRKPRSFSLDAEVLAEVESTKGDDSTSERVNQLLKLALELERRATLEDEAACFFANAPDDSEERRSYHKAAVKVWTRR